MCRLRGMLLLLLLLMMMITIIIMGLQLLLPLLLLLILWYSVKQWLLGNARVPPLAQVMAGIGPASGAVPTMSIHAQSTSLEITTIIKAYNNIISFSLHPFVFIVPKNVPCSRQGHNNAST